MRSMTVAARLATRMLAQPPGRSVFYGFAFALSSTAIVLRSFAEKDRFLVARAGESLGLVERAGRMAERIGE